MLTLRLLPIRFNSEMIRLMAVLQLHLPLFMEIQKIFLIAVDSPLLSNQAEFLTYKFAGNMFKFGNDTIFAGNHGSFISGDAYQFSFPLSLAAQNAAPFLTFANNNPANSFNTVANNMLKFGNDTMFAGSGSDTFAFANLVTNNFTTNGTSPKIYALAQGNDKIFNFDLAQDKLDFNFDTSFLRSAQQAGAIGNTSPLNTLIFIQVI